ncbi:hypothetical protein UlMin_003287 [Ulmus minor]
MGKTLCCEKNEMKRGPWTPEEDQKLIDFIQKHGHGRWRTLPKNAGLKRCGKSCRLRWTNYLRPDIKRGRFSFEEEETIIQLHCVLGNKWSAIAARLPGRTDNEIKNYWNTHIRKRLLKMGIDPVTHTPRLDLLELSSLLNSTLYNPSSSQLSIPNNLYGFPMMNQNLLTLATALLSSQQLKTTPSDQFITENLIPQNQFQSFIQPTNQFQNTCTTSNTSSTPFMSETQLVQPKMDQFSQSFCPDSFWENNGGVFGSLENNGCQDSSNRSIINNCSENQGLVSSDVQNDIGYQIPNMSFGSILSTPCSSPVNLHNSSSTTYVNSKSTSTEDEKDSFCSNLLMYDIANALNGNEFV